MVSVTKRRNLKVTFGGVHEIRRDVAAVKFHSFY